jgi:predicted DNA-binding transcriptional regulator YafY
MPKGRSYRKVIDKGLDSAAWAAEEIRETKPMRIQKGITTPMGRLFSARKKKIGILDGAQNEVWIIITYQKTTTGEVNDYKVAPYEYKFRWLRIGLRKMLYAYDEKDGHIKSFALRHIRKVVVTSDRFTAKWPIKI